MHASCLRQPVTHWHRSRSSRLLAVYLRCRCFCVNRQTGVSYMQVAIPEFEKLSMPFVPAALQALRRINNIFRPHRLVPPALSFFTSLPSSPLLGRCSLSEVAGRARGGCRVVLSHCGWAWMWPPSHHVHNQRNAKSNCWLREAGGDGGRGKVRSVDEAMEEG